MKIELKEITVRQLTEGYQDNNEAGVVGFGGKLDIRPPYQREFIYRGNLYNQFKDAPFDTDKLEKQVAELMMDEDVTKKPGIYRYVLTGEERHLNIRQFTDNQKREAYERQAGICTKCGKHFELNEMEADHATPWHEGGKTSADNCQLMCKDDNRRKSGK